RIPPLLRLVSQQGSDVALAFDTVLGFVTRRVAAGMRCGDCLTIKTERAEGESSQPKFPLSTENSPAKQGGASTMKNGLGVLEVARAFRSGISKERDRIESERRVPKEIAHELAH